MYTNFRSFSSQYSRRLLSILAHQQKQFVLKVTRGVRRNFLNTFSTSCINNFVFNLRGTSKKAKRKKMRSTHACTPSFRNFLHQYSRQLLSILAQHKQSSLIKHYVMLSATLT